MTSLLARPHGRLICLEFPSDRNPREAGPPWAVPPELYVALLARPGEEVTYDKETGKVASVDGRGDEGMGKGLKRLVHIKPARTHKAGYDAEGRVSDWISVWAWQQ